MSDITTAILDEHAWFRAAFAQLDEIEDTDELETYWNLIAGRLEVHAQAEETVFYPVLLKQGDDPKDETDDAIGDHNEIREAAHRAAGLEVGSDDWWEAVRAARDENSDHMGEEERDALSDFRRNSTPEQRHEMGRRFALFMAERTTIDVSDDYDGPDKDAFIEKHSPDDD